MSELAGIAVDDLDLDGWPDLCVTRPRSDPAVLVLRGRGDGTFDDPRAYWTEFPAGAVVIARLDGDGPPDVVVAAASSVIALPGRGDGTLGGPILVRSAPPAGVLAAD